MAPFLATTPSTRPVANLRAELRAAGLRVEETVVHADRGAKTKMGKWGGTMVGHVKTMVKNSEKLGIQDIRLIF